MKKKHMGLIIAASGVVILLLPLIFRKERPPLVGPKLEAIKYREVTFNNGELQLAGMLLEPTTAGPYPVVVMIHGSGTSKRTSTWYLTVAQHFQHNGIAVLLPDKRGSEQSQGDWTNATFHDLAGDTASAINFIREESGLPYSSIGIMGFSQGGWIAPIVATEHAQVDFVISMSGTTVTTDEQLMHEEAHNIADMGIYLFIGRIVANWTAESIKEKPFWQKIGGFDPLPYWKKVEVPVFMAFGAGDKNIPVDKSLERLASLNNPHITSKVYADGGHGISDPATNRVQTTLLNDLVNWIEQHDQP